MGTTVIRPSAAMPAAARHSGILSGGSPSSMEFQAMADEVITEFPCDQRLKPLDLLGAELDHAAGVDVDQVVVVALRGWLVPRPPVQELMALDDAEFLEPLHRPVDRRKRDTVVLPGNAAVQFGDIRMVVRIGNHLRDQPALAREPQAVGADLGLDPVRHACVPPEVPN